MKERDAQVWMLGRYQSEDNFREHSEKARQDRKCLKVGFLDTKLETVSECRLMGG